MIPKGGSPVYFLKSVIDIVIVLLLLRLLIRSREAFYDPIYRLIFKVTNPLLIPWRTIAGDETKGAFLSILGLVALRGFVYIAISPVPFISGLGQSLLDLFQLLFQGYMVIWVVSLLAKHGYASSFMYLVQRAFIPLNRASRWFGVSKRHFHLFMFLFLWVLYALLSAVILSFLFQSAVGLPFSILRGLGQGLYHFLALFPFPGFFSLVIIIAALLSWVSPDPSNPVVQTIYGISEPVLIPFRRFVPTLGGLDISPIVALLCFQILGGLGQQVIAGFMRTL